MSDRLHATSTSDDSYESGFPRRGSSASGDAGSVPGGMPAAIVAAVGVVGCFLPWYRATLQSVGKAADAAFAGMFGGSPPGGGSFGFGEALGGLGVSGTVTAKGIDQWFGVGVLMLLAATAFLHFFEGSQRSVQDRSNLLTGAVATSGGGAALALYGLTQSGGPFAPHVGLFVSLVAAVAATVLSIKRWQGIRTVQAAA